MRQTAVISFIVGTVEFKGENGTDWHLARMGFRVVPGDAIRTGPDSRAELQTRGPYSVIRVGENTTFVLHQSEEQGLKSTRARLVEGNLWGNVKRLKEQERFAFETWLATVTARGTAFRMEARGDTAVGVYVYEGTVEVKTQVDDRGSKRAATFNVGRGQSLQLGVSQPPQAAPVAAADGWRNGWQPKKRQEIEEEELNLPVPMRIEERPRPRQVAPALTQTQVMRLDILAVAPGVFSGIQLKTEGDRYLTEAEVMQATVPSVQEIEIGMAAKAWDALPADQKEGLLNKTFYVLKTRYPNITRFVTLKFDDRRQGLKLEYARYAQLVKEPPPP
ncbi:MAG: hypothetical protein A3F84_19500 [Candidatus Handelsmanbacteria bacterium RIFCSPLOWO2_12_FULL_64_10]|uniref:FecR protein domain-containing protein n=1 Tax=Handelsmanbacteria sp. (strain RIFCSPLOWO2_12_FULL_64_10) TaxID=1817868 RepID=A0A1F6D627_HANXR|nr:MAG: hypothetical protein A3F84_19500 [Candidatus Handelsmanbacteria bacterium RIFCSPLOWO2_12_FULL_64_10]